MRVTIQITFEGEMQNEEDLIFNVRKSIKPMLAFYNSDATIAITPYRIESYIPNSKINHDN